MPRSARAPEAWIGRSRAAHGDTVAEVQLSPRYDGPPILRFDGPPDDVATPMLRQRHRLADLVDGLGAGQWDAASRCEGWTVRDVIAHLVGVDQFWLASVGAALAGRPSRYLVGFDPVTVPAQLVAATQDQSASEVLAAFRAGIDALADAVGDLNAEQWEQPAETPAGHVPLHTLARHALWDAWIHERDIALPLGLTPVEEPDEVAISLGYVAILGTAIVAAIDPSRHGRVVVSATDPDVDVTVELSETAVSRPADPDDAEAGTEATTLRLSGPAVDLVEAISLRAPFPCAVPDAARWILGLADAFDATPAG